MNVNFEKVPQTLQEALAFANEIERLEGVLKAMKNNFKQYVQTHGPVETSLEKWDIYPTEQWAFNKESTKEIARYLILEGVNPWELMKFKAQDLKDHGWDEEALSKFGTKKITKRFTSRKL